MSAVLETKSLEPKLLDSTTLVSNLYTAVKNDNLAEVSSLLNRCKATKAVDIKKIISKQYSDDDKNTLLTLACRFASQGIVELLIKNGADPILENGTYYTPYLYAIRYNNKVSIKYLEELHTRTWFSKILQNSSNGTTPFIAATEGNHVSLMDEILKRDKEAYNQSLLVEERTPFIVAARNGCLDALDFLFKIDPKVFRRNFKKEYSPLMYAIEHNLIPVLKFILEKDKGIASQWRFERYHAPLHHVWSPLAYAINADSIPMIKSLLSADSSLYNGVTSSGLSALHFAAMKGSLESLKFFLARGCRMYLKTNRFDDRNEFSYAKENGHTKVLAYLNRANTIFHCAIKGHLKEIKEWCEAGNTLNLTNNIGNTLLHHAFETGQDEIAIYLIENGASTTLMNDDKKDFCFPWTHWPSLNPLQLGLRKGQWQYNNGLNPFAILKEAMKRLMVRADLSEKERGERIKALQLDFESLKQYLNELNKKDPCYWIRGNENTKKALLQLKKDCEMDYEEFALTVNKNYWCDFAKEAAALQRGVKDAADFKAKKEQLSHLIYSGHVLCKINTGGELEFVPPTVDPVSTSLEAKEGAEETKNRGETKKLSETDTERHLRLSSALKFAVEAEDYATAMQRAMEMTVDNPTLPMLARAAQEARLFTSPMQFWLRVMQMHYKPQKPRIDAPVASRSESDSRSVVVPSRESGPVTFHFQGATAAMSEASKTVILEEPKSKKDLKDVLPLDIDL